MDRQSMEFLKKNGNPDSRYRVACPGYSRLAYRKRLCTADRAMGRSGPARQRPSAAAIGSGRSQDLH